MRIVADTNIIIRILISPDGMVAGLFYGLKQQNDLIISYTSIEEINKHKARILRLSGLKRKDFDLLLASLLSDVTIVPPEQIPDSVFIRSFIYMSGLDYDDVVFVATSILTKSHLWTSDKHLFYGLKKKGFITVLNNADIKKML